MRTYKSQQIVSRESAGSQRQWQREGVSGRASGRDLETAVQRRHKTITSLQTQITTFEAAIAAEKQNGRQ